MMDEWTSRIIRGWLCLEEAALAMAGNEEVWHNQHHGHHRYHNSLELEDRASSVGASSSNSDALHVKESDVESIPVVSQGVPVHDLVEVEAHATGSPSLSPIRCRISSSSTTTTSCCHHEYEHIGDSTTTYHWTPSRTKNLIPKSRTGRCLFNGVVAFLGAALVVFYAVVHVHIIQEDGVFYTTWFYEWFLIPILLSFVFAAPLHRALGFDNPTRQSTTQDCWRRVELLEGDPTTQRLVAAVAICHLVYIVGDAAFFIPISPSHDKLATYPTYLLAVVTNICFLYQGFLLTILTMRAVTVRLQELEAQVSHTLQQQTDSPSFMAPQQIQLWTTCYQDLRQDVLSLSSHFGLRMVIGITMFVVEVTNTILNVWEAVGSTLTKSQTILLLLMYTANSAVLIIVTFQIAYLSTLCAEVIGPQLALLSMRSQGDSNKAELNVLAQTLMQAPIRLRIGNFHVTAEYANALAAWFFGLFLVVFGIKVPNI